MRGGGDHVAVGHRAGVLARRDEAGEVGHVGHEVGPHRIGDLAEAGEVELTGIGRPAGDDQLGLGLLGDARELVHVEPRVLLAHAVGHDVEVEPGEVDLHPVGEMAAVIELHAQDPVTGIEQGHVDSGVGLGAGVRLDVGVLGPEQLLRPVDGQLLGHVHVLAAAVVALAGIALRVLVGEHRSLAVENRLGNEVLGGDHLERPLLAAGLVLEHLRDLRIDVGHRLGEEIRGELTHLVHRTIGSRGLFLLSERPSDVASHPPGVALGCAAEAASGHELG